MSNGISGIRDKKGSPLAEPVTTAVSTVFLWSTWIGSLVPLHGLSESKFLNTITNAPIL